MQTGASGNMVELKDSNTLMSLSKTIGVDATNRIYTICSDGARQDKGYVSSSCAFSMLFCDS